MIEKQSLPSAPILIESIRSIGYSFETAIADLIDNSISAKATRIDILSIPNDDPYIIIFDNGNGMDKIELEEAMRLGSKNPNDVRIPKNVIFLFKTLLAHISIIINTIVFTISNT